MVGSLPLISLLLMIIMMPIATHAQEARDKRQPPKIEKPEKAPEKYYKNGAEILLPCKATGLPTPRYEWKKNGEDLGIRTNIRHEGGNIRITDAGKEEEGYYQCRAINQFGVSLSSVFHLQMAGLINPPGNDVGHYFASAGSFLKVPVRGVWRSVPAPVYSWYTIHRIDDDNPQRLPSSKRVITSLEGSLYFTHVEKGDSALLKVTAFNDIADEKKGGSYTNISVTDPPSAVYAPVAVYPEPSDADKTAIVGEELILQCIFKGYPQVDVTWKESELAESVHPNNGTLKLGLTTWEHEKQYTCTGTNSVGQSHKQIKVKVESHPDFAEGGQPESVLKNEGDTATFHCQASPTTKPKASVTWLFNGEPIDVRNPGPRIKLTKENRVLTIVDLRRDSDIRVIQCNVSNKHGYVFADAALNVLVKTEIVKAPENQTVYENTTNMMFECQIKSDPLYPAAILWTHNDKPIEEYKDTNMVLTNENRRLNIRLENVTDDSKSDYQGQYACIAKNDYSNAKAVAYLSIHDGPEKEASFPYWAIILLAVIGSLLLLIIVIITSYTCIQRNKGPASTGTLSASETVAASGNVVALENISSGTLLSASDVRVDPTPEEQQLLEQLDVGLRDIVTEKNISCKDFKIQSQIGKDVRVDPPPEEQPLLEQLNVGLRDIITEKIISCQDFKIQRQIGKGNFGKVFHATLIIDNQERSVALKTLKDTSKANKESISEFLEEAMIMKDFDHPNVLSLIGVIVTKADLYVVLPYMAHGDLRNHIARQMFDEDIFLKFVLDVVEGMKYLSSQRFVHRDLAARNCMVNADGRVLIGDFGLARDIYEKDYYTPEDKRRPLPFKWMAPESMKRMVFNTKSDVWSFGITMWEIYTQGDRPYPTIQNLELLMYLQRGNRLEKPPNCPDPLYNVMYLCWHKDPAQRPGFPRLLNEIIQVERHMMQNKGYVVILPDISTESIQHGEKSTAESQPPRNDGSSVASGPPMLKRRS